MGEVVLPITWSQQEQDYYCGPAVAKMYLAFKQVARSQDDLWCDVVVNTGGTKPAGAPPCPQAFPEQACDSCKDVNGNTFQVCWDSSPEALAATINAWV